VGVGVAVGEGVGLMDTESVIVFERVLVADNVCV
jgi:hypothetical protein